MWLGVSRGREGGGDGGFEDRVEEGGICGVAEEGGGLWIAAFREEPAVGGDRSLHAARVARVRPVLAGHGEDPSERCRGESGGPLAARGERVRLGCTVHEQDERWLPFGRRGRFDPFGGNAGGIHAAGGGATSASHYRRSGTGSGADTFPGTRFPSGFTRPESGRGIGTP